MGRKEFEGRVVDRESPAEDVEESPSTGLSRSGPQFSCWANRRIRHQDLDKPHPLNPAKSPTVVNHLGWPTAEVLVIQWMVPVFYVDIKFDLLRGRAVSSLIPNQLYVLFELFLSFLIEFQSFYNSEDIDWLNSVKLRGVKIVVNY